FSLRVSICSQSRRFLRETFTVIAFGNFHCVVKYRYSFGAGSSTTVESRDSPEGVTAVALRSTYIRFPQLRAAVWPKPPSAPEHGKRSSHSCQSEVTKHLTTPVSHSLQRLLGTQHAREGDDCWLFVSAHAALNVNLEIPSRQLTQRVGQQFPSKDAIVTAPGSAQLKQAPQALITSATVESNRHRCENPTLS
ncbi:hypothetical protein BVRB_020100, partial [Beta vulgaris subsp. vulgaris]